MVTAAKMAITLPRLIGIRFDSRGFSMVIAQKPTQSLAAAYRLWSVHFHQAGEQQEVRLPLTISLCVVMRSIFAHRPPQAAVANQDYLRQALIFD